jgi:DNA adenine methylase
MSKLPTIISKISVPPIKCQGIKTKLIPFIAENIEWNGKGKWIEPFLGSGVVLFNIQPDIALISDTNKHIIELYK